MFSILPILLFFSVNVRSEEKSSLVFVFDTTGSMYNDLKQLREGAEMILKTALEEGNVIGDFVFVPFHDPAIGPATVTKDKEVLKRALDRVKVHGGGDCPEKSLGGIQMALDRSQPRSYVYVFTDATAGDHRLVGKVLDAVQRKQSQVVFVLTGHCNDLDKPSFKVYQQIAAASSGQVFNLNKTSVHKVLDFVKSSIKGRMVNLGSSVNPAGSNTQEVPVDSTLAEVTVSVSGASPQISVLDPRGAPVTPPQLVTTLDLAEIMVVKVLDPEPGSWQITVGSEVDYSVKVSGLSNVTFEHGFSVERPRDMGETSYRPLKGTYNHMMISLAQDTPPVTIDYAEILSMNGSTLFELPLTEVDKENKIYLADAFIPPEEFFYVAINGKDELNQPLKRIGSTAVQAKVPDVPYLITPLQISERVHSRVVLPCKVDSLVPLSAMWMKDDQELQPLEYSVQTTTIEYVIEDLTEEKSGTYKCYAKNVAGVSRKSTVVTVTVEPPQVSFEPANLTLEVGDNATLTCTVLSEALLLDLLMISRQNGTKRAKTKVEPSIDGVYRFFKQIVNASVSDTGNYTCKAVNKGGTTNLTASITVHSPPSVQILGPHSITQLRDSSLQLSCLVKNCDSVRWERGGVVVESSAVGGLVTVSGIVTEDGVWRCIGRRGQLEASDSVNITMLMKPTVSIAGDKNITVLNGTTHELVCEITGRPPPRVVWHRETEEFLKHDLTNTKPDTYISRLTLNSSVENIVATYFCYGENSVGITQDHVQVNVRRGMTVVDHPKDISQNLYNMVKFTCKIDSYPPPSITWRHNGTHLRTTDNIELSTDNTTLVIKRIDFNDLGLYSCKGENGFDNIELNATLSVEGLELPKITKGLAKIITKKGDSTLLSCRIEAGNPTPNVTWQYPLQNGTMVNGTELNLIASEKSRGSYRCVATNVLGEDTYDVELLVHYPPTMNSSRTIEPLNVAVGSNITLACEATGDPLPLMKWTRDNKSVKYAKNVNITKTGLSINNVTETDSGNYICNATNSLGASHKNFTVVVYEQPNITSNKTGTLEVIEGQLVDMPCAVKGAPKPEVTWEFNGAILNEDTKFIDDYGIRFVANLTDFGNYTCKATNKYGHSSTNYSLYVWVPPFLAPVKNERDVLIGDDVNLQCDAVGFPVPRIDWAFGNKLLMENTSDVSFNTIGNLNITNASLKHEGVYVCLAKNNVGIDSNHIKLNVNELPNILEDNYTGAYLATSLDSSLTIGCLTSGKPKPYVVWSKDDVYLHKDSQYKIGKDNTLTIKTPSEDMSGNYTCTAKNKYGMVNKTVKVDIFALPTVIESDFSQNKATVVENEDAIIECPIRSSERDTVKWYKDAEMIATGNLTITNVTRKHEAIFACVVTNAIGSAHTTVKIEVEWAPSFIDKLDNKKENTGINITKNNNNGSNIIRNGTNRTQKPENEKPTIKAKDTANKNETHLQDKSEVKRSEIKENTKNNTSIINQQKVVTKSNNTKDLNNITTVKGDDVYLDCQTDAKPISKIKWQFNSKRLMEDKHILSIINVQLRHKGYYKCEASNPHGTVYKKFQLNVLEPPFISEFDVLEVSLLEGSNATLECNARGVPEPTINWTYNNTNWHEANSTLTTSSIMEAGEGLYRCDAVNEAGATHIAYVVSVLVAAKVEEIVLFENGVGTSVDKSLAVGLGAHIRIACQSSGKPSPLVKWLRNGKVLSENSPGVEYADLVLDVEGSMTGRYSCVAANEGGEDERTVKLEVLEPPKIIRNRQTSLEVLTGQPFFLHCHALGNPPPHTYWFKDGLPLKLFDERMVMEQFGEVVVSSGAEEWQAGRYTCVQRNAVGGDNVTYSVSVLVPPPQPKDAIKSVKVRVNKPVALTCPVEGSPPPNVMWIKHPYTTVEVSSRVALSADNVTLSINRSSVSDSGNYSCIMGNKAGTAEVVFSLTVIKPPSIAGSSLVQDRVVLLRRSVVLKCEAEGHPLPTITWLKDTQKLSPTSSNVHAVLGNSLLAVWTVTTRDAAQYVCVAENEAGSAHARYNLIVQVPGKWSSWGNWSLCNATCGTGQQRRARSCRYIDDDERVFDKTNKPDKIIVDESACKGPSVDKRKCQMPPCEVEGTWLAWSAWSVCSAPCGRGTQARSRRCRGQCRGDNVQIRKCPDLPKCSSTEDLSENDVFSDEDSKENAYIPEAVFEKEPEFVDPHYLTEVEQTHVSTGEVDTSLFVVNATTNLDGSEMGTCRPGFRETEASCEDVNECTMDKNECHLTQLCENLPGGYLCRCQAGYAALGAGQRCMDINECSMGSSGCEFACVNTAGGYVCACPADMRLHRDKHHCITVSQLRSYEDLDNSEYMSTSVEHPARYKHIK